MRRCRIFVAGWMIRLAVSVLPAGDLRETLRTALRVWLRLLEDTAPKHETGA
jgi:hypothetical protein